MRDWAVSSVLSLALVVGLVAIGYVGLVAVVDGLSDERVEDRLANAVAAANVVNQAVGARATTVQTAATAVSPWSGNDQERARAFSTLERLVTQVPELATGVVIVDADATVVVTVRALERLLGDVLRGPHLASALAGSTSVSPIVDDPVDGEPGLQVATPLRDAAGNVTGALIAFSPVEGGVLTASLARVAPPPGTELVLVGPAGTVLTRPDATGRPDLGRSGLETQVPATAAAEGSGTTVYTGEGGIERFAAYAPVDGGWAVVQFEERAAIEALPTLVQRAGAGVGVLVIVLVAAAIVLAERRRGQAHRDAELAKRSMLAVAGHELRTPLTVVRGMATTAVARWESLDDDRRLQLISTIDRQARTLDHLVERLLYAAHLEAGIASTVDRRPVDVSALAKTAVSHHAELSRLHTFTCTCDDAVQAVGDRKALDQVLFHLLDNAAKYTPSGGSIHLTVRATRRSVELVVEDEGVGLPADPARLFDAFTQLEAVDTRTHDEGGVGLGLYIVRSLVELMGGAVHAEPAASGGARFVVTLAKVRVDEPVPAS